MQYDAQKSSGEEAEQMDCILRALEEHLSLKCGNRDEFSVRFILLFLHDRHRRRSQELGHSVILAACNFPDAMEIAHNLLLKVSCLYIVIHNLNNVLH